MSLSEIKKHLENKTKRIFIGDKEIFTFEELLTYKIKFNFDQL